MADPATPDTVVCSTTVTATATRIRDATAGVTGISPDMPVANGIGHTSRGYLSVDLESASGGQWAQYFRFLLNPSPSAEPIHITLGPLPGTGFDDIYYIAYNGESDGVEGGSTVTYYGYARSSSQSFDMTVDPTTATTVILQILHLSGPATGHVDGIWEYPAWVDVPVYVHGHSVVTATATRLQSTHGLVTGRSTVTATATRVLPRTIIGRPQLVAGSSALEASGVGTGKYARLQTIISGSRVKVRGSQPAVPDVVIGASTLSAQAVGSVVGVPDVVAGSSTVMVVVQPDLSENDPIQMALTPRAVMNVIPPQDPDSGDIGGAVSTTVTQKRAMATVSYDLPTYIMADGEPVVPKYLAQIASSTTVKIGPSHIHAGDPAPKWNPRTGGWDVPPPSKDFAGRWVVDDLPDPPSGGYYWLGNPSHADGTSRYSGGRTHWAPHASTPHAPTWHSFFPYKPSVRAYDAFLPGGGIVHHPKGVHFNSHFVEHMWMDWGGARRQPFTWVIAALIAGYPSTGYVHHILDSGRNPDSVHFPRLSAGAVYDNHTIHDNLEYRTMMTYSHSRQRLSASVDPSGPNSVSTRSAPGARPKMMFGVFNGAHSLVGNYGQTSHHHSRGRVSNSSHQAHRFYVMGREYGHIGHAHASHILVFEVRYWQRALTLDELEEQYKALSSTYQFHRYRSVR